MNQPNQGKRTRVIAALAEGNSIRVTVRMTGASKNAIQRLLAALGPACEQYQNRVLRNPKHISTSFVERQNLTMRMQMRRFSFAGARVQIYQALDGRVALYYGDTRLEHAAIPGG